MTDAAGPDLFGEVPPDPFVTAKERYGVWPTTVWPLDAQGREMQELKSLVGDDGRTMRGVGGGQSYHLKRAGRALVAMAAEDGASAVASSTFNPLLATALIKCFGPEKPGVLVDPFAGGGTRAICAAKAGHRYHGVELRAEECAAVRARCATLGVAERVTIHQGDARQLDAHLAGVAGDMLLTCPPYWNLEVYGGGERDL